MPVIESGAPPILLSAAQFYGAAGVGEMRAAAEAGALLRLSADPYGGGGGAGDCGAPPDEGEGGGADGDGGDEETLQHASS